MEKETSEGNLSLSAAVLSAIQFELGEALAPFCRVNEEVHPNILKTFEGTLSGFAESIAQSMSAERDFTDHVYVVNIARVDVTTPTEARTRGKVMFFGDATSKETGEQVPLTWHEEAVSFPRELWRELIVND